MIPRRQPLHSHRNYGLKPIMEDVRESGRVLFAWIVLVLGSATAVGLIIVIRHLARMVFPHA